MVMQKPSSATCSIWITLLLLGSSAAWAEPPAVEPRKELAVLDPFVGSWQASQAGLSASHQCKWILNQQFLEIETNVHLPGQAKLSWRTLLGYDQKNNCYRMWRFSDQGDVSTAEGAWDKQTTTLTLSGRAPSGNDSRTRFRLIRNNTFDFEVTEIVADDKRQVMGFSLGREPSTKDEQPTTCADD